MQFYYAFNMIRKSITQRFRKDHCPILIALSPSDKDAALPEIDILNPESNTLHKP